MRLPLWIAPGLLLVVGVGCATVTPDRTLSHRLGGGDILDLSVAVRVDATAVTGSDWDEELAAVFPRALHDAQVFRRVNYSPRTGAQGDLAAELRIVSLNTKADDFANLKVYGTVLTGLLLAPFIQYHDTFTVVGELEVRGRGFAPLRRYVARGEATRSTTLGGELRAGPRREAIRAALQAMSAKLIDELRRDAAVLAVGHR
jgi:hypothetical protein